jgi:hypothetical protein
VLLKQELSFSPKKDILKFKGVLGGGIGFDPGYFEHPKKLSNGPCV